MKKLLLLLIAALAMMGTPALADTFNSSSERDDYNKTPGSAGPGEISGKPSQKPAGANEPVMGAGIITGATVPIGTSGFATGATVPSLPGAVVLSPGEAAPGTAGIAPGSHGMGGLGMGGGFGGSGSGM